MLVSSTDFEQVSAHRANKKPATALQPVVCYRNSSNLTITIIDITNISVPGFSTIFDAFIDFVTILVRKFSYVPSKHLPV